MVFFVLKVQYCFFIYTIYVLCFTNLCYNLIRNMKNILRKIVDEFNFKKQADELGVSVWKSPPVLFIMMGFIIISSMLGVYFAYNNYGSVETLIISETALVVVLFSIGASMIGGIDEMARANKLKTEFVSVASHQLKTPLSAINWEVELLSKKFSEGLTDKQKELLSEISNANERMSRLVNDLLDVARIDQGRLPLMPEEFSLEQIIKDVIDSNKILARTRNVEVSIDEYGKIPFIWGDKRRMVVVMDNLISNAIKYISKKGKVSVAITSEANRITVCVKDNGVGIPKNQQKNIAQKFFRSDNAIKNQTEGTGLGLYIAKNVVKQSGGDLWFNSEEGIGSTFCFYLPIKKNNKYYSLGS